MKKFLFLSVSLLLGLFCQAQNYELKYKLELWPNGKAGAATVIGVSCNGLADIVIPMKFTKEGIPYTVAAISGTAFKGNAQIRSFRVEGEGDPISIENGLFEGCTSLEKCDMKGVDLSYGAQNALFKGCTALKEVSNLKIINFGQSMFEGCSSLKELHIPYNCTYAYKNAFKGCSELILFSDYVGVPKGFSADDKPCTPTGLLVIPEGADPAQYGSYDYGTQGYKTAFTKIMTMAAWKNGGKEPVQAGKDLKPSVTMNNIQFDEGGKSWQSNLYRGLTVVYDMTVKDFPTDDVLVIIRFFDANGKALDAVDYGYRDSKGKCCSMSRLYRNTYNPARFRNNKIQIPYNAVWRGYGPKAFKYRIEVSSSQTGVIWKSQMKSITIINNKYIRTR